MKSLSVAERLSPSPGVAGIAAYRPPAPPLTVDLFLDSNEGATPRVELLDYLRSCGTGILRRYPSRRELEQLLAARYAVEPDQVLITCGADEAIDRACRAFLSPGRELILPVPTFEMFERYARLAGATVRDVSWRGGDYPLDEVIAEIGPQTAAIVIVSPNNPTGAVARAADLRRLAEAAPQALLIVDAAYAEFAEDDLTAEALSLPNAIVLRSFSKAWGVAGLRVGYAMGAAEVIRWLRVAGGPYSVSQPSLVLAGELLRRGDAPVREYARVVRRQRDELIAVLRELNAKPSPSQANFVWCRFKDAEWVKDALAGLGIWVRSFPNQPEVNDCLRITCPGGERENERLRFALRAALAPEALLFDMDGVMADVSQSFREAIRLTAAQFGVSVTPEEIAAVKAGGNASNDWDVTQKLLARHGVNVELDDVIERFEALYQGSPGLPGLRETERPTVPRELIARWAERFPLTIVTGRPRADAERFLSRFDLARFFSVVICLEDAPAKPDPTGVRLALSRLGVSSAWMVGDTPDDIRAARDAGAVPLGVLAPGSSKDSASAALAAAGAARVLENLSDLEGLFP